MYIAVRFIEKLRDTHTHTHTQTNKVASQGLEFTESNNCSFNFYPNSGKEGRYLSGSRAVNSQIRKF